MTASTLRVMVTSAVDLSDLYRSAIMQSVSAFDHYIHEEIRLRILDLFKQDRSQWPAKLSTFPVPLGVVGDVSAGTVRESWLSEEIRLQHGHLSYQHPDKIADGLRLISDTPAWETIAGKLGITSQGRQTAGKVLKRRWQLIIDRRNLIVHESDLDPTPPRDTRYPIDHTTTEDALRLVSDVAESISELLDE